MSLLTSTHPLRLTPRSTVRRDVNLPPYGTPVVTITMADSRNVARVTSSAREILTELQNELTPPAGSNRLLAQLADGSAPVAVVGALAAEERSIIQSDWRAFLTLAAKAAEPGARQFFSGLAGGEGL